MSIAYIIVVYGFLHNQIATVPGTFPDLNTCQAQLAQTHFTFPDWGQCQAVGWLPTPAKHRYHQQRKSPPHK